jgi:hypothetical protein
MKEDRRWSHYVIDVPDELADRYKSAFAEWEQVQNELHLRFLALHREATLIEKSTRVEPVPAGAPQEEGGVMPATASHNPGGVSLGVASGVARGVSLPPQGG